MKTFPDFTWEYIVMVCETSINYEKMAQTHRTDLTDRAVSTAANELPIAGEDHVADLFDADR